MRSRTFRLVAAAVLAAASAGAFSADAGAVVLDAATIRAAAGRTYVGSIAVAGDTHAFFLDDFALSGMTITIALKADKSDLEPDLTLMDPSSVDQTDDMTPYRKDGTASVSVKKLPAFLQEGRWILRVKGKNSTTGDYKLKITIKCTKSFKGTGTVPGVAESNTFNVPAPTDALVKTKIAAASGESLQPEYGILYRAGGLDTPLALSTKPGQASFVNPVTGIQTVAVNGAGATEGVFVWSAKLKLPKAPKTPIRVNGAPETYPAPGPLPAKAVVTSGSAIRGFETDGVELSWREVRTSGGGPNVNKNSLRISKTTGALQRNLANNFAVDVAATATTFAMGPTETAVFAEGEAFHAPRLGTGEQSLTTGLASTPIRALASTLYAYFVGTDYLEQFDLDGSGNATFTTSAGTIQDACLGGKGVIYVVLSGGNVKVYTQTESGTGDGLIGDLGTQASAAAVVARGRDVFVAVDGGAGTSNVYRVDALGLLAPVVVFTTSNPIHAMAVDDANVYVMEDDATDASRVVQVPRGGGVRQVLVRDNVTGSFAIDMTDIAAAGGYVYLHADVLGTDTILRVKRTK